MKSGKTQTLYTMLLGFWTEYWKNLYKSRKEKLALQTQLDLRKKAERSALAYLAGTPTYKKTEYPSRD